MINVLIIDTETTGLHPSNGSKMIEIGALVYNVKHKIVTQTISTFFTCYENPVEHINGIKPEWTQAPMDSQVVLACLNMMSGMCNAIVAHNAQFDKVFLQANIEPNQDFWKIPWVCTKNDFAWPVRLPRNRLQDVCEAMGVPYVDAHRALTDCHFIANCFTKVEDLNDRLIQAVRRE